ncbi:DUF6265 family protein [Qipengyuania sp.]|uniref:DUF6265 family protein n=1 Tax=Qipengyuania sp. TaxID=2004515 RepID=UPI0035C864B1
MRLPTIAMLLLAIFSWSAGVPARGQETRIAPEDHVPPAATIDQLAWLVGRWSGTGIEGGDAHESWLAPTTGGTMVGTFVQETPEGEIMLTEHMYLGPLDGSLAVRLKHFGPDLVGWEDREEMVTFRLIALEPCAAYFTALTYRCDGDDGMVVAVRMKSDAPEPQELVFRFKRQGANAPAASCPDAATTPEMNACWAARLGEVEARMERYFAAALDKEKARPQLQAKMRSAQQAFAAYANGECDAVLEDWSDGTIRTVMALDCRIALTNARTHAIWQTWLTYPDSTAPVLPEPEPMR